MCIKEKDETGIIISTQQQYTHTTQHTNTKNDENNETIDIP